MARRFAPALLSLLLFLVRPASAGAPSSSDAGAPSTGDAVVQSVRRVEVKVTEAGFEPREITTKRGQPITLAFTRLTERTCITAIDIPDEGVKDLELPLKRTVTLTITPRKRGVEPFHCSAMGMGKGRIVVED